MIHKVRNRPAVHVYPNGREVCDLALKRGKEEYERRKQTMRIRQDYRCCLEGFIPDCPGFLDYQDVSFEHEDGRGMGGGKRDDRIEKDGRPYNGAAHGICNALKGSRYFDYNKRLSIDIGLLLVGPSNHVETSEIAGLHIKAINPLLNLRCEWCKELFIYQPRVMAVPFRRTCCLSHSSRLIRWEIERGVA